MSQKEKNGKTVDMDFSALDLELAQLAEETPDVPEDFHDQWTKAIREEAASRQSEETVAEAGKTEHRKADVRKQRRYILSAAAAFVLIIGGVWLLLGKDGVDKLSADNPFSKLTANNAPVVKEGTVQVSETDILPEPGTAPEEAAEEKAEAAGADMSVDGAVYEAAEESNSADEASYDAGEASNKAAANSSEDARTAGEAGEADSAGEVYVIEDYEAPVMFSAMQAMGAAADYAAYEETEAAYEADGAYETDAAGEAEAEEEEDTFDEEPAATPEPTAEPTPEPTTEPTPEPTTEPVPEPIAVPEPAAEAAAVAETAEENVSFLQRVWDWVLKVTPWALMVIVVVLFLVTYVLRIIQRRRKQDGKGERKHV